MFRARSRSAFLTWFHLVLIFVLSSFLALLYLAWPWREWRFADGLWQWLSWCSSLEGLALTEIQYHLIGSLFLIPIVYATAAFGRRGAWIVSMLALVSTQPMALTFWTRFDAWLTNLVLLLLPGLVAVIVTVELELRRRDRKHFIERENDRQLYLSKIIEAQERERERLAQELHDETIQTLLAVASHAEDLELVEQADLAEVRRKAAWIKETIRNTAEDLRSMSLDLRPGILDDLGLIPAMRWMVDSTNQECNVHTQLSVSGFERKLPPSAELTVFRVVQEALSNVKRHSAAKQATVEVRFEPETLKLSVRDDGRGFVLPSNPVAFVAKGKLGLIGMQQRVRSLDGNLVITSASGEGTVVSAEIPLSE